MTRTSTPRKAKQRIIATTSVIAILTIVQRRSSKCSRNGLDVSLSGNSRNLKRSRSAISGRENNFAREQTGPRAQGIGIANRVVDDHPLDLCQGEFPAIVDRFTLVVSVTIWRSSHRFG